MERIVYCIATLDSKGTELEFLQKALSEALHRFQLPEQIKLLTLDVSTGFEAGHLTAPKTTSEVISGDVILSHHPDERHRSVSELPKDRGQANSIMSQALEIYLRNKFRDKSLLHAGAIGIGGSGGTSLIAPALRTLPIGVPKMLVSTVASGNTSPYVGSSDLVLVPSVVDIAGLNSVSRAVLSNAAAAFAGMVGSRVLQLGISTDESQPSRPTVGMTMFGVTTSCADAVRGKLERAGYEVLVFHATGAGGRAMENLVAQGFLQGIIDLTTTEVADHIVGGVMSCDENRFMATLESELPLVLSVGALDMVNFGAKGTLPSEFSQRQLHVHNSEVTLMRTTPEENRKFARFIAERINKSTGPVRLLFPEKGVSALDAEGMPFFSPEAAGVLLEELQKLIQKTSNRELRVLPYHINDPVFSDALVESFMEISRTHRENKSEAITPQASENEQQSKLSAVSLKTKLFAVPEVREDARRETVLARRKILQDLHEKIRKGTPIIGAGAGTGISAKFEEEGGVDLIVIYNSGRFRMAGRGSLAGLLPFKDANAVVVEMADEVLPVVKHTPVLAGVCATDPFRRIDRFLRQVEELGFVGVQNFPTVGLFDGKFRQNLEETGMGFGLEVEMIRVAHQMGLLTTPYAFSVDESRALAEAGADIIVAHMGLTTSGSIGATSSLTLDQSVELVQQIADAAVEVNPETIVLCHGGPIAGPEDAAYVLRRTKNVHGFYGASSMERLPVETAIRNTVCEYKSIRYK